MLRSRGDEKKLYDVAILGTGVAGTMLGSILAKAGHSVLMIDAGSHPRFAIGESTIPYTLVTLRTIAERYNVPEIKSFAAFTNINKKIGNSFGVKKHFGFLHHEVSKEQNPLYVNQYGTPGILHESSHLFRQDMDQYMFHVALRYGCHAEQNMRVTEVDIDENGVRLHGEKGQQFKARYICDGSGFRSPLAIKFGARDTPCRFKHHSRSMFTHMVDVKSTDECIRHRPQDKPPAPWETGTIHHLFKRGWFWVIPFNNAEVSRNPLISVGLTIDERTYPKPDDMSAEEEFFKFARMFPVVERQFRNAKSVREWVSTDRLQYSASKCIGDRWCMLAHATGFLDPLFSRGLSNTAEVINALAWRLIEGLRKDDLSRERFEYVERLQMKTLDFNDNLVNCSYISFEDYDLWNAIFRIWSYGANMGTFRLQHALTDYLNRGDASVFLGLEDPPNLGLAWPDFEPFRELYDQMIVECEAAEAGKKSRKAAADVLFSTMENANYLPPAIPFGDRTARYLSPNPRKVAELFTWLSKEAPPEVKEIMLGTSIQALKAAAKGQKLF